MNKKDKFIKKATDKFGDKYDYSIVEYKDSTSKIAIKCNEHDIVFYQSPSEHLRGKNGCEDCKSKKSYDTDSFINKSKEVHGNKYDYSRTYYEKSTKKVTIICPEHGEFQQSPINHMKGQGCPKCGIIKSNGLKKYSNDDFIKKTKKVHGDEYDYSKVGYKNSTQKVIIICPEHGEFLKTPSKHLKGQGCPQCSNEVKRKELTHSTDNFIKLSKQTHGDRYDYSKSEYFNGHTKVKINCPDHGEFEQLPYDHISGHGCVYCSSSISQQEMEINGFLKNHGIETITSSMSVIPPYQLDMYIPERNLAIEFNGLYWHNELHVDKNYHLNKTKECENKGVQLIHIFEDEWLYKEDIVKSVLLNKLDLTPNRTYARDCKIDEIDQPTFNGFLDENHLQGRCNASVRLGLFISNELIGVMGFNKPRAGVGTKYKGYELSRFCTKKYHNIIGGANKLFKYFIRTYKPEKVISYSDRRYSNGNLYENLGFKKIRTNRPNHWIIKRKKREHRFNYRKDRLVKEGFDPNKSEHEIMLERGIYRIYDCGTETWEWRSNT